MKKIFNISIFFYISLVLVIFFKVFNIFLYFIIFVFFHELAHILTAKYFGLKLEKLIITPIGQMAIIKNLEYIYLYKRIIIVLSGIFLSFFLSAIFHITSNYQFRDINLSIALFNCLPIFPLDGGRLIFYILGKKIGTLNSSLILKKLSFILSIFMFILGFIQIILYPYNISLLCIAIYFVKINKREYIFNIYKLFIIKEKYPNNKILDVKTILVSKNCSNKNILSNLSIDYYLKINVLINGKISYKLDEKYFIDYIQKYGINGTIYDVVKSIY